MRTQSYLVSLNVYWVTQDRPNKLHSQTTGTTKGLFYLSLESWCQLA